VRKVTPSFQHLETLPKVKFEEVEVTVLIGELCGLEVSCNRSQPARTRSRVTILPAKANVNLEVDAEFEHGLLIASGSAQVIADPETTPRTMPIASPATEASAHLRRALPLMRAPDKWFIWKPGARRSRVWWPVMNPPPYPPIGGAPFDEPIVTWWNLIARSHEEIVEMREQWNSDCAKLPQQPVFDF
jgi:redox-sensitive bicupin YhaK (pirin superfamily)